VQPDARDPRRREVSLAESAKEARRGGAGVPGGQKKYLQICHRPTWLRCTPKGIPGGAGSTWVGFKSAAAESFGSLLAGCAGLRPLVSMARTNALGARWPTYMRSTGLVLIWKGVVNTLLNKGPGEKGGAGR
jgi:hypothetical protein